MKALGFFDGAFLDPETAAVRLEDRGYQFGDGVYEVTRVYDGKLFAFARHMKRFRRSLRAVRIPITYMDEEILAIHQDLIQKSGIQNGHIYMQVTRGFAPRAFSFPTKVQPMLSLTIRESMPNREQQAQGMALHLAEDVRWLRCDIKSLNLLGAVLAKEAAHEAGCQEALLYRKDSGLVTEGASSNFLCIKDGVLWTHPLDNFILPGVTRAILLEEIAPKLGLTVVEKAFTPAFAQSADEAMETSTTLEVTPVVRIGKQVIGDGKAGKVTRQIMDAYQECVRTGQEA